MDAPIPYACQLIATLRNVCDEFKESKKLDEININVTLVNRENWDVYALGARDDDLIRLFPYEEGGRRKMVRQPQNPETPNPRTLAISPEAISYIHVSIGGSEHPFIGFSTPGAPDG